jgi:hypothetical protein
VSPRRPVSQEDPDLAVLDPPGCPGVLPGHPGGLHALLQEAGVVDDQHTIRVAEVLDHVVAHLVADGVDVPVGPPQQPLHPVRRQVTGLLRQGPAVLTIEAGDQPGQILPGPSPRLRPGETIREPGMQPVQFTRPLINIDRRHEPLNEPIIDTFRLTTAVAVLVAEVFFSVPDADVPESISGLWALGDHRVMVQGNSLRPCDAWS